MLSVIGTLLAAGRPGRDVLNEHAGAVLPPQCCDLGLWLGSTELGHRVQVCLSPVAGTIVFSS